MKVVALTVVWSKINCVSCLFSVYMVIVYSLLLAFLRERRKLNNVLVNISTKNWELDRNSPTIGYSAPLLVDK